MVLARDDATVEIGSGAPGALQRSQRIQEPVEKLSTTNTGRVASHDLVPGGVVDAWREVPILIELRYHNTTIPLGWDGICASSAATERPAPPAPSGRRQGRIAPPL